MSSGLECTFVETAPSEWFYLLQNYDCPVGAWDWREHATAYGPFRGQARAKAHLNQNHANPGGWSECAYDPAHPLDETIAARIQEARKRRPAELRREFRASRGYW